MPDPNWNEHEPGPDDNDGVTPAGQTTQPTNGAPTNGAPAEPKGGQGEGVQQIKHSDFKRIKDEQRAKGRREAIEDLDARAREAGFESHADALKALAALKKTPPTITQTPIQPQGAPPMPIKPAQKNATTTKDEERLRAESIRAADDRSKMRKQWRQENRRRRELEAQLQAKDAEIGLREECYRAGVKDVDYVIRLLTRELQGKTQEEIAKFDRSAFYEACRKDKPYLFGETVVAATTGTGGEGSKPAEAATAATANGAPAAPNPGASAVAEAEKKRFDARTAKPEEVQARLRELGLNPHM